MFSKPQVRCRMLALAAMLSCASAAPAALLVDFGETNAPANELQAGFSAFSVTNATSYQGTFFDYAGTGIDNGTPVRVTIDGTATGAAAQRMVDRGVTGWTGGQDALLRDWIGIDVRTSVAGNGTDTTVRLDNLAQGLYRLKSYHTDIGTGGNQQGVMDLLVNGETAVHDFQIKGQAAVNFPTTTPNFLTTVFEADGSSTVDLTYRLPATTTGTAGFPVINGIEVERVFATTMLAVDFNDRANTGAAHTQAGFNEFLLDGAEGVTQTTTTRTFNNVSITLTSSPTVMDDRRRAQPTNSGAFTDELLLRDFIFVGDLVGGTESVDILVQGLAPDSEHLVTIWSFDDGSPNARVSDWLINGVLVKDDYTFDGNAVPPAPLDNDVFSFTVMGITDAQGNLLIQALGSTNTAPQLFLNAIQVQSLSTTDIPEPATALCGLIGLAALSLRGRSRRA